MKTASLFRLLWETTAGDVAGLTSVFGMGTGVSWLLWPSSYSLRRGVFKAFCSFFLMEYLFIFGRDHLLSFGELVSYLKRKGIEGKLIDFNEFGAIYDLPAFNPRWIEELGGILKIAKIEFNFQDLEEVDERKLKFLEYLPEKFAYGINIYGSFDVDFCKEMLKRFFKEQRFKAFEIPSQESFYGCLQTLPSDILRKKLVETESDFIFFEGKKKYFARTVAVSDPFALEKRDLERPARNPLEAISIRLAKILINLSQVKQGETLLDPFCGIGTILQEAALQGIDFQGIDLQKERVEDAKRNLTSVGIKIFGKIRQGEATRLSEYFKGEIDGIATEPYLGPLIKNQLSFEEAQVRMKDLEKLYRKFFQEAVRVLKKGGFLVVVLPYFKTRKGEIFLPVEDILPRGLRAYDPLQGIIEKSFPLRYEERKIGRMIYVLRKV